jgi:hypothetical protein
MAGQLQDPQLGMRRPHPDYVAGHPTFSNAAAAVLASFYGADGIALGAIFGAITIALIGGGTAGPWVAGAIRDANATYRPAFQLAVLVLCRVDSCYLDRCTTQSAFRPGQDAQIAGPLTSPAPGERGTLR